MYLIRSRLQTQTLSPKTMGQIRNLSASINCSCSIVSLVRTFCRTCLPPAFASA